ncbi:MAG: CvpA family protein [Candidatus Binatia bacterium]
MNFLDFAVLALILLLGARGFFRGFFRELFGAVAWLGAGVAGYLFAPEQAPQVAEYFRLPVAIAQVIAFFGIFLAIYIAARLTGWLLARLARALFLSPLDRFGGLAFGAAKALVIATLFCMVVTSRRGMPTLAELVNESPMLSALVAEGWNVFAIAQMNADVKGTWQRPYSKMELDARTTLSRFLTPKPDATPSPSPRPRRTGTEGPT